MTIMYEDITPIIPNTTMQKMFVDGVHKTYNIKAADGYDLHDTNYDVPILEGENYDEIGRVLGYHNNVVSCSASYQFEPAEMLDENGNKVTAYGTRQFFAKKSSDVYDNPIEIPAPADDADEENTMELV